MGTVTINFILAVGALYVVVYQDDADEFNTLEGWFRLSRIGINTAVVLVFFALRALAVGTIRRERENTERHVMAFQRRHYALLGLQTCCLTYVACYAVSMPLMPFTITKGGESVESSLNWRKCLHDFNTSYIADNCYREPPKRTVWTTRRPEVQSRARFRSRRPMVPRRAERWTPDLQ